MKNINSTNLIGNKDSKEIHTPDCWWAKRISGEHIVRDYHSFKDALYAGYDSCGHCLREYTGMIHTGYLIINEPPPFVKGEFILPANKILFSKEGSIGGSFKINICINEKEFTFNIEKRKSNTEFSISKNQEVKESKEELTDDERDVLELFLVALNKEFIHASEDHKLNVIPVGRAALMMLSFSELPETKSILKNDSKAAIKTRYDKVKEAFENNPSVSEDCHGQTADYFIRKYDNSNFVNTRREQCVYKGESVQAWWNKGIGENKEWKKSWCIIGGKYGGTEIGCAGTADLIGDIDLFMGWFYSSTDHDMCQVFEGQCFGPCTDEFILAIGDFIAGAANYIPGIDNCCDGNNPGKAIVITKEELEAGSYSYEHKYEDDQHPMAGRKIDTPANWTIDFYNKKWVGPPLPEISNMKANPNPFDQRTGTTISFNLSDYDTNTQSVKAVIELYHHQITKVVPAAELKITCKPGLNNAYWNGMNDNELAAAPGWFDVIIRLNGSIIAEIDEFVKKKINSGTPLPISENIPSITFAPNPFNIKTGTNISFELTSNARVSMYIYHKKWTKKSTRTIFENKALSAGKQGPFVWNGRNNQGVEVTNGEYKVKIIADGYEKTEDGLVKKLVVSNTTHEVLPPSDVISNIRFSPNPFTVGTKTKIQFDLSEQAMVSIYIYHINWKKKSTKTIFENRPLNSGPHTYEWNGRNNKGKKATNGEYRVKFVVNGEEKVKRGLVKIRAK